MTFWAPVIVMLIMYRRIYKEALRQKEAIRRSSVPSQQHLIVDSDSVRSRFQTLQANGFRSVTRSSPKNKKSPKVPAVQTTLAPKPLPPPPSIAITQLPAPPPKSSQNRQKSSPPPIIMTSSDSLQMITLRRQLEAF